MGLDLPCVCGHTREEHRNPKYPSSTECFAVDEEDNECDCIAYEADLDGDDGED